MELLDPGIGQDSKSAGKSFIFSCCLHVTLAIIILFFPRFGSSQKIFIPSLDVTLYDLPEGNMGSSSPQEPASKEKAPVKEEPKPKDPVVEEPKPKPKSKELIDPSDAEMKKMKKRVEDWTPAPKKSSAGSQGELESDFPLGRPGVPGGRTSGSLSLDTASFPYMYYLVMMKNKISENWMPPMTSISPNTAKRSVIAFVIDRSGAVTGGRVEESSGDDNLDQSALRAVMVSSPFPPLPEGFPDTSLGVHFGFRCEM
jgi:periplasmic protein TonB